MHHVALHQKTNLTFSVLISPRSKPRVFKILLKIWKVKYRILVKLAPISKGHQIV